MESSRRLLGHNPLCRYVDHAESYGAHIVRAMLGRLPGPCDRILDIGAGQGRDLGLCGEAFPLATRHALESHPPNVEILRSAGVEVRQANIEEERFPYADAFFDLIIANQVLEHVKEIFFIMHEVSRTLRVGGSVIVGVPNVVALHNRLLSLVGIQPACSKTCSAHVRSFSRGDFLKFLNVCWPGGFRLAEFAGCQFYPFPSGLSRALCALAPTLATSIFFRLEKTRDYAGEFSSYLDEFPLETNFRRG